ncbi:hypothetical protein LOZ57_003861 [Ophidiomyces ophidiicola]|uniref:uncharacterized protein n=1 Tax=Ophidiomyces ophidiicola TaxID=1387563 RepID=UPI0020C3D300|nr:uncharacterized protein LOZ57_003861 [Ophidiomyces ophidiicola]KAI1946110.1 hypothetical protein LOZ57_003861 [Ophidiomyces ophidiicola]KAI2050089.1 hypothetical protein LOZ43_004981 [Ophidiomyces ophidiicola]
MPVSTALKCYICPKKPNFSDVSHLLTHVSSKGHLSHYFKLQVRSHQEPEAGQLLAEYDQWYQDHNLAGLLSDRMMTKEARKDKGRNSSALYNNKTLPDRRASTSMLPPSGFVHASQRPIPSYVDPELSQPFVAMTNGHATDPRMQLWPMAPKRRSLPTRPTALMGWTVGSPGSDENDNQEMSPLSLRKRQSIDWHMPPRTSHFRPTTPDPFVDDASYEEDYDDDDDESEQRDEITKLKGVFWPGMDIFDSATEQMRRKRNQKKDGSVLKQMEKTSEMVEATELVFSPGGTLRKARQITGMVDESSPLKGETPIPKKRPSRPKRQPLSQGNANRILRSNNNMNGKLGSRRQTINPEHFSRRGLSYVGSPQHARRSAHFGTGFGARDEDFRLSYSDLEQKPPREFAIFNDGTEASHCGSAINGNKAYYNPLGNAGHFALNHQPKPFRNGAHHGLKSFSNSNSIHMPEYRGKENIEPIVTQKPDGQYIQNPSWDSTPLASESRYGTQYMYGAGFQGYGSFGENESFGYSSNPLSCSLSHIQHNEDEKHCTSLVMTGLLQSPERKLTKSCRNVSPDGTVSELDQDDIGRMYLNDFTA